MSKTNDFETPPASKWDGPSGVARDSVWMSNEDLPHDKDTVLTVEQVNRRDNVKFQTGKPKPIMLSLQFRGVKRELGLNATNRKVMARLFGPKCAAWVGKRIALFVTTVSSPQGEVPAVRIRAREMPQRDETKPVADNPLLADAPKAGFDPKLDADLVGGDA